MTKVETKALNNLLERATEAKFDAEVDLRLLQGMLIAETDKDTVQQINQRIAQLTEAVAMIEKKIRMIEGMTHAETKKRS